MNLEDRLRQLEELFAADPADADLPFLLGKTLLDLGRYEAAAEKLELAARMNPRLAAIHRFWGEALAGAGRRGEALKIWESGIALSEETGDLQAGKEMKALAKRIS